VSEPADPEQNRPGSEPGPVQPRIGDAEREQAIGYLQEHMAQGRLDRTEFDERLTRAFAARTAADLQPLFQDLPDPRPGTGLAPVGPPPWPAAVPTGAHAVHAPSAEPREHMPRGVTIALAAVWPAAILLSVATSFRFWWIWVVAAMVTYFLRQAYAPKSPDDPHDPPAVGR